MTDEAKPEIKNRQLSGRCDLCPQYGPLYVVPDGRLREPYLCKDCAAAVLRT